jgi:hypothetical protein
MLANGTMSAIATAIGVSWVYASHIRAGTKRPHPRHWVKLAELVGYSANHTPNACAGEVGASEHYGTSLKDFQASSVTGRGATALLIQLTEGGFTRSISPNRFGLNTRIVGRKGCSQQLCAAGVTRAGVGSAGLAVAALCGPQIVAAQKLSPIKETRSLPKTALPISHRSQPFGRE